MEDDSFRMRLTKKDKQAISKAAKKEYRTMSSFVRAAIWARIKEQK